MIGFKPASCNSCKDWSSEDGMEKSANSTSRVVLLVQGKALGFEADFLQILEVQMKIAAGGYNQPAFEHLLKLVAPLFDKIGNERMFGAGMWRADDMGNAFGDGHLGHGRRHIKGVRAVIETGKDVAMNVDHSRKA